MIIIHNNIIQINYIIDKENITIKTNIKIIVIWKIIKVKTNSIIMMKIKIKIND
jgi:hypothetical protein